MAKNNDYLIVSQNTFTPKNESNVVGIVIPNYVYDEKPYLLSIGVRQFAKAKTGKDEKLWIIRQ